MKRQDNKTNYGLSRKSSIEQENAKYNIRNSSNWCIHAVASSQITVDEVKAGQVWHSFGNLLCKLQQLTSS